MTIEALRPHVSKGSRAMLAAAFPEMEQATREALVREFLAIYQEELGRHSVLFDGVAELLDAIEAGEAEAAVALMDEHLHHIEKSLNLDAEATPEIDLAEALLG